MNPIGAARVQRSVRGPRFHVEHVLTRRTLSAYLDGVLAPAGRERVSRHIGECAECRRSARALELTIAGLACLDRRLPAGLAAGILKRLDDEPPTGADARRR